MRTLDNEFYSLESAYRYVAVLSEVVEETQQDVDDEVELAKNAEADRRVDALQLVAYKLERLRYHLKGSREALNDLRMLRRILRVEEPLPDETVSYNQGDALARDPQ